MRSYNHPPCDSSLQFVQSPKTLASGVGSVLGSSEHCSFKQVLLVLMLGATRYAKEMREQNNKYSEIEIDSL